MSQGTKIVAVVLFVLFVGTGVYYVTLSPAKPATPPAAKATEPAPPKPPPARDPGSIVMNPATGAGPSAPRIADPLAAGGSIANPPRVALGSGGTPVSVMPPLTMTRPSAPAAPTATVSVATVPGVPEVLPTAPAPAVTSAPAVASRPTLPTSATVGPREHVVASGETLSSIAARYLGSGNRWAEIAKANPGVNPNSMRVGTKLNIPAASAPVADSRAASTPSAASANEYVVKAGDTLTGIARQTLGSADWESIYEANRSVIGSNPAALRVGMRLAIPKRS
jgi:LysM repeat protein